MVFRGAILLLSLLLVAAIAGAIIQPRLSGYHHFAIYAILSRQFLTFAAVFLGSAIALLLLVHLLWRAGKASRAAWTASERAEGGNATVEFVLVLPIVLMITLILMQSMLLMTGNLCVHYSAFCAARTAIVTLPRNVSVDEPPNIFVAGGTKMQRITDAAIWAVLPVSCGSDKYPQADASELQVRLKAFFNQYGEQPPAWIDTTLPRRLQYARDNTKVWLEHDPLDPLRTSFLPNEDVIAKVDHTLYLSVPIANRIFQMFGTSGDSVELGFSPGEYGMLIHAKCRLPNEGVQDWVETERFTGGIGPGPVPFPTPPSVP